MLEPDQGQFVLHFRQTGDPEDYLCIMGFRISGGSPRQVTPSELAAFYDTCSEWTDYLSSAVSLVQVDAEYNDGGGVERIVDTGLFTGTRSANALLQNTAYLVHKRTNDTGRGAQGRMYIPGVPDDKVNNVGVITGAEVVDWNSNLANWMTAIAAIPDLQIVVNHGPLSPLFPNSTIQSLDIDPVCASQRRRLRR